MPDSAATTSSRQFVRLWSNSVLLQAHASRDSKFLIVPVLRNKSIAGWRVYETSTGQLLVPETSVTGVPEGYADGVWEQLYQARDWITTLYGRT